MLPRLARCWRSKASRDRRYSYIGARIGIATGAITAVIVTAQGVTSADTVGAVPVFIFASAITDTVTMEGATTEAIIVATTGARNVTI
jgi:hypothetical protein